MSLTELADLGEILAALGVVASLIYVGYQIRETRKAVRAATAQARTDLGVHPLYLRYCGAAYEIAGTAGFFVAGGRFQAQEFFYGPR